MDNTNETAHEAQGFQNKRQELFEKVWHHYVTNKQPPGYQLGLGCVYFCPSNGSRCSVGVLLDDFAPEFEDSTSGVPELLDWARCNASEAAQAHVRKLMEDLGEDPTEFLIDLQQSHDVAAAGWCFLKVNPLERHLTEFAQRWKLQIPAPPEPQGEPKA